MHIINEDTISNDIRKQDYQKVYNDFNEYVNNGYGVTSKMILDYITCLFKLGKLDKSKKILKHMAKEDINTAKIFIKYFYYFNMYDDIIYIYNNSDELSDYLKLYVADSYLYLGDIEKAYDIYYNLLINNKEKSIIKDCKEKLQYIYNNKNYNSFIKTAYDRFIEKGNSLKPGHIVYLKDSNVGVDYLRDDDKKERRPFLIVEINGNKLYVFPVTTKDKGPYCKLCKENYPNIGIDRWIKIGTICRTNTNNIRIVADYINEKDLKMIKEEIFKKLYLNDGDIAKKYIKRNAQKIEKDCIVRIRKNKEYIHINYYYYILDIMQDGYLAVEVSSNSNVVIGDKTIVLSKDTIPFSIDYLSKNKEKSKSLIKNLKNE